MNFFNTKYSTDLKIHTIIQGEPEELELIHKVCDCLLDMFFNLDIDDNNNNKNKDNNGLLDDSDKKINIIPDYEEFIAEFKNNSDFEEKEDYFNY